MSELSSSAKLSMDEEILPSESNEMRFANTKEIRHNHHLFDEKEYSWLYYNLNKKGFLCKICEVFYGESSVKPVRSRGHGHIMMLPLKIILVMKMQ